MIQLYKKDLRLLMLMQRVPCTLVFFLQVYNVTKGWKKNVCFTLLSSPINKINYFFSLIIIFI